MILSDVEIKEAIDKKQIGVYGWNPLYIGPCSIDLHLDNKAMILKQGEEFTRTLRIDRKEESAKMFEEYNDWEELTIYPNEFYILSTIERISFPRDVCGFIQGRSSIARMGLNIHAAGFFDVGFSGTATLEVTNPVLRRVLADGIPNWIEMAYGL